MKHSAIISGYSVYLPFAKDGKALIDNLKNGKQVNKTYWFKSDDEAIKCGFKGNKSIARLENNRESMFELLCRLIDNTLEQVALGPYSLSGENVRVYLTGLGPRVDAINYKSFYDKNDIEDIKLSTSVEKLHVSNMSQEQLSHNISNRYQLKYMPPNMNCTSNSSLAALHLGCQAIEQGDIDLVLVVNCSEIKTQDIWFLENQSMLGKSVPQPFGKNSNSILFSEGYCVMLLENSKHKKARQHKGGVQITSVYRQVSAGRNNDVSQLTISLLKTMEQALHNANITCDDICAIIPHGNGSAITDKPEAKAISMLLGEKSVPVLAYKGQIGYVATGSGLIDLVIGCHSLHHNELLSSIGHDEIVDNLSRHLFIDQKNIIHDKHHLLKVGVGIDGSIIGVVISNEHNTGE